jgi:hypothetical protein
MVRVTGNCLKQYNPQPRTVASGGEYLQKPNHEDREDREVATIDRAAGASLAPCDGFKTVFFAVFAVFAVQ